MIALQHFHLPRAGAAPVNRLSKLLVPTGLQVVALKLFGLQLKRLPLTAAFPSLIHPARCLLFERNWELLLRGRNEISRLKIKIKI